MTGKRKAYKITLFIYFIFELILSACPMYGWPSLVYILRREGYYDYLCQQATKPTKKAVTTLTKTVKVASPEGSKWLRTTTATPSTENQAHSNTTTSSTRYLLGCPEQEERLNGVFIINIIVALVTCFPSSILVQKFGPRIPRIISSILFLSSGFTWIFASNKLPFLIYPASILFSIAGTISAFTFIQVSAVVYDKSQSTVLSFGTGAYDASAGILVLLKLMYDSNPHMNFLWALGAYSGFLTSIIFISTLTIVPSCREYRELLTTKSSKVQGEPRTDKNELNKSKVKQKSPKPFTRTTDKFIAHLKLLRKSADCEDLAPIQNTTTEVGLDIHRHGALEVDMTHPEEEKSSVTIVTHTDKFNANRGFRESFLSVLYFWELLFVSVSMTRMYFYVSAFDNLLSKLSKKLTTLSVYTNFWGTFQFGALILGPILGAYIDGKLSLRRGAKKDNQRTKQQSLENLELFSVHEIHKGTVLEKLRIFQKLQRFTVALAVANTVGIIMEIVVLIPVLKLQLISMFCQVASREFMYAVHFSYLAAAFPPKHYGKLVSLALVFGCGVSFIQYPLLYLMEGPFNGDPYWIHVGLLVVSLTVYGQVIHLHLKLRGTTHEGWKN